MSSSHRPKQHTRPSHLRMTTTRPHLPELEETLEKLKAKHKTLREKMNDHSSTKQFVTNLNALRALYNECKSHADSIFRYATQTLYPINKQSYEKGLEFQAYAISLFEALKGFESNTSLETFYKNKFNEIELQLDNITIFLDSKNALPALIQTLNKLQTQMDSCWEQINLNKPHIWEKTLDEFTRKYPIFQENRINKIRHTIKNLIYSNAEPIDETEINKLMNHYLKPNNNLSNSTSSNNSNSQFPPSQRQSKRNKRKGPDEDKDEEGNDLINTNSSSSSTASNSHVQGISTPSRNLSLAGVMFAPPKENEPKTPVMVEDTSEGDNQPTKLAKIKYSCLFFDPDAHLYNASQESQNTDMSSGQSQSPQTLSRNPSKQDSQ